MGVSERKKGVALKNFSGGCAPRPPTNLRAFGAKMPLQSLKPRYGPASSRSIKSLYQRRWYRRLCHFFKLKLTQYLAYLFSLIPPEQQISYDLHNPQAYAQNRARTDRFSKSPGGGVHNMLRVRVCAAHMGGFLGPKFSRQGSLFRQIFHKHGWVFQKLAKNSQKWVVFRQNSS